MIDFKLPFSATDHGPEPTGALAPLLARDMLLMLGQIGVMSLRASVVDMDSMAFQSAWGITEQGEVTEDLAGRGLDSTFPAAMATIAQMGVAPPEQTVVRKLSPRHWAFAWRIDERLVAVAEARYRDQRDMMSSADTALVRLICDTGIRVSASTGPAGRARGSADGAGEGSALLRWPDTGGAAAKASLSSRLAVLLIAVSALLALWTAIVVAPRALDEADALQKEVLRQQDMGTKSMLSNLGGLLATGDYGEVQSALSTFTGLGYFQGAVITNARQRVVAIAGTVAEARIGDGVPPALSRQAQTTDLMLGADRHGQLLTFGVLAPTPQAGNSRLMWMASALAGASALLGLLLLVMRFGRRT